MRVLVAMQRMLNRYVDKFDGIYVGGEPVRRGGRYDFVNCGQVQVELIEPPDPSTLDAHHVMDHVGYVTRIWARASPSVVVEASGSWLTRPAPLSSAIRCSTSIPPLAWGPHAPDPIAGVKGHV